MSQTYEVTPKSMQLRNYVIIATSVMCLLYI